MAGTVMQAYVQAYIDHEKPLVSLINGPAVGISVTVLPLFDLVLASDAVRFLILKIRFFRFRFFNIFS